MSTPSPLSNDSHSRPGRETGTQHADRWSRLFGSLKHPLQFVCFWAAITLPFVHLSLLAQGIESMSVMALFFGLLVLNLFALYVGHGYNQA